MIERQEWNGFEGRQWKEEINVRDFIVKNYTPYDGDDSFLEPATEDTKELWAQVLELSKEERELYMKLKDLNKKEGKSVFEKFKDAFK